MILEYRSSYQWIVGWAKTRNFLRVVPTRGHARTSPRFAHPTIGFVRSAVAALFTLAFVLSGGHLASAAAAEITFTLPIANGRLPETMRLIRVHKDDVVKLRWSTDKTMSLHLHGYDIEKEVSPGMVTEMSFTARATGRFAVEPHLERLPSGGHAHGDVLVTIEVYP